jgi:HEAT repeat protein
MTIRLFVRRLAPAALATLALALGAGCEGAPESAPAAPPPPAASPAQSAPLSPQPVSGSPPAAPPPVAAAPTGASAPQGGRPWMEAELARLTASRPDLVRALRDLQPGRTRGGLFRFVDERTAEPGAAAVLLDRLLARRDPPGVRRALAELLPEIGCPCGDVLIEALDVEPEPLVREAIVQIFEYAPMDVAERGLRKALSDADPTVRVAAAFVIPLRQGAAPGRPALAAPLRSALLAALDDPEPSVQDEAARAAGILRLAEAAPRLEGRLSSPRAGGRLHALRALHRIDPGRARSAPALARLKADPDARVARLAASIDAGAP